MPGLSPSDGVPAPVEPQGVKPWGWGSSTWPSLPARWFGESKDITSGRAMCNPKRSHSRVASCWVPEARRGFPGCLLTSPQPRDLARPRAATISATANPGHARLAGAQRGPQTGAVEEARTGSDRVTVYLLEWISGWSSLCLPLDAAGRRHHMRGEWGVVLNNRTHPPQSRGPESKSRCGHGWFLPRLMACRSLVSASSPQGTRVPVCPCVSLCPHSPLVRTLVTLHQGPSTTLS